MNVGLDDLDGPRKFAKKVWWGSLLFGVLLGMMPHVEGRRAPICSAAPTCERVKQEPVIVDSSPTLDSASDWCSASFVCSATHKPPDSATTNGPGDMPKVASALRLYLGFASPASAAPGDSYVPDTAPWVNVNRHFGAAIRTGRIVPVTPNPNWLPGQTLKDGGVYMVAGDWPGWARSVDGAKRFESAVSGRLSSKNVCGGYDAAWYGGTAVPSTKLFCSKSNQCSPGTSAVTGPTTGDGNGAGVCDYADNPKEMCTFQVKCSGPTDTNCRYCSVTDTEWCMKCTGGQDDALVNREWSEAGPPSSLVAFHGATASSGRDVAAGPTPAILEAEAFQNMCKGPANQPGCAKSIMYTANDWWSFFSPDAGRDWFRLTPQCEMSQIVGWGGFAADRGMVGTSGNMGGHLVGMAVAWGDNPVAREASGCVVPLDPAPTTQNPAKEDYRKCAERSIAWTDDVGPELAESMMATSGSSLAWRGKSRTERAGGGGADVAGDGGVSEWAAKAKWRYSSINHLPAPAAVGGTCKVYQGGNGKIPPNSGFQASIPSATCPAALDTRCHGRRAETKKLDPADTAPADRDAWCPNYNKPDDSCKCTNGPTADCRYPNPTSVEIDPRNGWAYVSSDVGLLSSPSGGRRWIRQGGAPLSNQADIFKKMTALDTFSDEPQVLGAKLYTKQYHCGPGETSPCNQDPAVGNSLDLNANPDRIAFVGRMSLVFTPCPTDAVYGNPQQSNPFLLRRRGHLVATVPVEWQANDGLNSAGQPKYRRVSSVFMAAQRANCEGSEAEYPPAALEFWDTAHLELISAANVHPDLQDYNKRARTHFGGSYPKLLQNLHAAKGLPLRYTAAEVAPSDPRVLWAFSHGYWPSQRTDPAAVPTPLGAPAGHLLWRSLDGGATWHIALPAGGPAGAKLLRDGGGIRHVRIPEHHVYSKTSHKLQVANSSRPA